MGVLLVNKNQTQEQRYLELFGVDRYTAIKRVDKSEPETIGEAKTWETVKNKYLEDGLCITCVSQAAWGHQNGFKLSWSPCINCKDIVANFPRSTSHPDWRCWPRGSRRPATFDLVPEPNEVAQTVDPSASTSDRVDSQET